MARGRARPAFARGRRLEEDLALRLPEDSRKRLAAPFAEVFEPSQLAARAKGASSIVVVGDVSAGEAIRRGLTPKVIVVDFKTKRGPLAKDDVVRTYGDHHERVRCPPAHVTGQLWNALLAAVARDGRTRIEVDGEEDLAVMPAIILLEAGAIVIYGLPDRGVTLVRVDEMSRRIARKFLESFEVVAQ